MAATLFRLLCTVLVLHTIVSAVENCKTHPDSQLCELEREVEALHSTVEKIQTKLDIISDNTAYSGVDKRKNEFVRFGKSDVSMSDVSGNAEKRKNEFVRFGRAQSDPEALETEMEKRKNEFVRFGRMSADKRKNEFVRFGKKSNDEINEEKRKNEFVRFG